MKDSEKLYKIVNESNETVDDLENLTLAQAENELPALLNEGADVYIQDMQWEEGVQEGNLLGGTNLLEAVYELAFGDDAVNKDYSPKEVLDKLREFSDKALHLDKIASGEFFNDCTRIVFGSGTFLCTHINEQMFENDGKESKDGDLLFDMDSFVEENAWEPFQYWKSKDLYQQMDSLGQTHEADIIKLVEAWNQ